MEQATLEAPPARGGDPATRIPVLLYHAVADTVGSGDRRFTVAPAALRQHMALFVSLGLHSLTVTDLVERLRGSRALPPKPVVVTFDDGYADFLETALPVLERNGVASTLYVTTGPVGRRYRGQPMLSWAQLREVRDRGVEIGAHTHTHPELDVVSRRRRVEEISRSKSILEERLERPVASFAYPHGYHSRAVKATVREAGYGSAVAVKNAISHSADDVFALARLTVTRDLDAARIGEWLGGRGAPLAWAGEAARTRGWRWVRRARAVGRCWPRPREEGGG